MTRGPRRLIGVLVVAAAVVLASVALGGGGGEGTLVAKNEEGVHDYACQLGGTVMGPVAMPVWGTCSAPGCWRLVVRDSDGDTSEPCVSRSEYDRTRVGEFRHGRTDG